MVLFTILVLTLITLATIAVLAVGTVGAATIVAFGDIIVCVLLMVGVIRYLIKRGK